MAKKVMQRVFELIDEEEPLLQEFLKDVLRLERVHLTNADSGAREKLSAKLIDYVRERSRSDAD